jgi:hypothetical protein
MTPLRRADVRALAAWLEPVDPASLVAAVEARGPAGWARWRHGVFVHGLAPHLARLAAPTSALGSALPDHAREHLGLEDARNTERIRRMHGELAAILEAAEGRGIPVMPLKGAVLTTMAGEDPWRRPMADLDLLVAPPERGAMFELLADLGYRHAPERAPRPTHDVFTGPDGGRVVTMDGEHPDNPRRVELHTEVRRHLWGWVEDDDLTALLWRDAVEGRVLGRPAMLPSVASLLVHLAIHASSDLLVGRGRLVAWLDLARLAPRTPWPADAPHPRMAWPSLALAARALPTGMVGFDPKALAARVPPRLVRWAASVPLDDRSGLSLGVAPDAPASMGARWQRWRPESWRLAVAYGGAPVPVALARHAARVTRLGVQRFATRRS